MRLEHWLYTIPLRLRSIFRRTRIERELEEELRFHLDQRIAQEMAAGRTPEEARYAALRAMGGIEQRKEECRDLRQMNFIDNSIRDLRFGLRVLRKSPAFTAMAILTLTLGIGANTAIFSVVNAVLLRPLPYPYPEQLVRIYETNTSITDSRDSVSAPNFSDWRDSARSFSGMGALRWEAFTLTAGGDPEPPGLLIPLSFTNTEMRNHGSHDAQVFARLLPAVTPAQAQVEMEGIAERLAKTYSNNEGRGVRVIPLLDDVVGNYRQSLLIIFAAAGLILLISCANLANALLARGVGQRQEIAVRLALGASRMAIIRQVLIQNLILAVFGCACAVLTAYWALKGLQALAPSTLPRINEVSVNGETLAFAAGASILTGLSFGLLLALQLSSSQPYDAMKGRGATAAGRSMIRWRDALVVAQVALSLILLVGAGLLLKSFAKLRGIDIGFRPGSTLALKIILPQTKYPEQTQRLQFFAALADRVKRLPGVEAVGYTNQLPMRGGWGGSFRVEHPEVPMGPNDDSDFQIVSSGYFQALRIRLLRGRLFSDLDRPGSEPMVIVNNAFARRYWPTTDPIGQRLTKGKLPFTIAGIVEDVHLEGPGKPANIEIYFPAAQAQSLPASPSDFAVRTAGDPRSLVNAIRDEVRALDREQPVTAVLTMDEVLGQNTSATRFNTLLLAVFAALALMLAAVGVYGIVSYSIAQRSAEIGIRMAVGARPADILRLILRQIAPRIAIGALLGIATSLALSRYAASMLFGVAPRDPAAFALALSVLVVASLLAAYIPARRAMRIDPIIVLRAE